MEVVMADDEGVGRVKRTRVRHKRRVHEDMDSLDVGRMSNADLVRPPSASRAPRNTKVSRKALERHNREKPTHERAYSNEFTLMRGEIIDTRHKGEKLLVNLSNRARGAGVMFNRGQISERELRAAFALCELADLAGASQLSGLPMSDRVDGGMVDLSGSRLTSAAAAAGKLRDKLELLSRCQRVLVENVIIAGVAMEDAVRLRSVANRLGDGDNVRWKCKQAIIILRDGLDHLADLFNIAEG
jgi:hypothetical protein